MIVTSEKLKLATTVAFSSLRMGRSVMFNFEACFLISEADRSYDSGFMVGVSEFRVSLIV